MEEITLIFPTKEFEKDAKNYVTEHFKNNEKILPGAADLENEVLEDDGNVLQRFWGSI